MRLRSPQCYFSGNISEARPAPGGAEVNPEAPSGVEGICNGGSHFSTCDKHEEKVAT